MTNVHFQCSNGSPEDAEVLRALCNGGPIEWTVHRVEDEATSGWGLAFREEEWDPTGPSQGLLLFATYPTGSEAPAEEARFSAYVGLPVPKEWMGTVPVFRGEIHLETLSDRGCGAFFVGSASLQWRATTIRVHWTVAAGC
ncbi:MAG: hypothetical protein KF901_26735 [Myxococcales bacterium]|nr:hypothetical protein [Myxococcales bacterium]